MTGGLVQIFDEGDPLRSDTTLLVASLLTLGIPPAGTQLFHCTCEMVAGALQWRSCWSLKDESRDGRFDTVKMQKAWADGEWLLKNPKHPLAILRGGLTYKRAVMHDPKFTADYRARIENPDTWLESAFYNLVFLLREMPKAARTAREIVRFGSRWAAMVPQHLPEEKKTKLLKYVQVPREARTEKPAKAA